MSGFYRNKMSWSTEGNPRTPEDVCSPGGDSAPIAKASCVKGKRETYGIETSQLETQILFSHYMKQTEIVSAVPGKFF